MASTTTHQPKPAADLVSGIAARILAERRAAEVQPETHECGAGCGQSFPTLAEVFSHPCTSVPQWAADRMGGAFPIPTSRGDSVDAPERRESTGGRSTSTAKPARTNRYAGQCTRCGGRVEVEQGVLVRNHAGGSGGSATWDVTHRQGECAAPAPARPVVDTPDITAQPEPAPPADPRRANRYPGACVRCGAHIEAEAGKLVKTATGWGVDHPAGPCPVAPAPAADVEPEAPGYVPEKGDVHVIGDGFYRVQLGQHSRRLYVVRWMGDGWEYAGGVLRQLSAGSLATAEDAARFGAEYQRCVFCTRELDLPESQAAGYGQTCAAKRGLPWG